MPVFLAHFNLSASGNSHGDFVAAAVIMGMKIYDTKTIDCAVNGKLRMVSLNELLRLIVAGKTPALTKQGHADLKKLLGLLAQIQIQGDWLLQSPWAIPNPPATAIR